MEDKSSDDIREQWTRCGDAGLHMQHRMDDLLYTAVQKEEYKGSLRKCSETVWGKWLWLLCSDIFPPACAMANQWELLPTGNEGALNQCIRKWGKWMHSLQKRNINQGSQPFSVFHYTADWRWITNDKVQRLWGMVPHCMCIEISRAGNTSTWVAN